MSCFESPDISDVLILIQDSALYSPIRILGSLTLCISHMVPRALPTMSA